MIRYGRGSRTLAVLMAMVAGYVDAVGFLASGGFYLSFMSGNSTQAGVGILGSIAAAAAPLSLVACFVAGVVLAAMAKRRFHLARRSAMIAGTAAMLAVASLCGAFASPFVTCLIAAAAMGWLNLLFEEDGEVRIGLTYMTGTLVKLGHHVAGALGGGPRWQWVPFALLWSGLIVGAAMGALAYKALGLAALWIAAVVTGMAAFSQRESSPAR